VTCQDSAPGICNLLECTFFSFNACAGMIYFLIAQSELIN
jgi:hypothetical protein